MSKFLSSLISLLLVAVMVFNLVPLQAIAATNTSTSNTSADSMGKSLSNSTPYARLETAEIVEEDISKRGEYYKEFVLNNGFRLATLYPNAIHYETDGQWKEIDNTLVVSGDSYTNTSGVWNVSFPKNMSTNDAVTIQNDGYTLSFYMTGELRNNSNQLERASLSTADTETFSIQSAQAASAQIAEIDLSDIKAGLEHPEIFSEKTQSRLEYANVYSGTNIIYDLDSNRVKESIVMQAYSAGLRGYRYTVNVGELNPVLTDSGEILLYDCNDEDVIMTMPAPFLVDNAGEYCYDVTVTLTGTGSTYTLTYLLPQNWLASSKRQWPVILDPMVDADTSRSNIRDISVYEQNCPHDYNAGVLDVGHNSDYGIMRSFLKYDVLPALTSADVVVNARLALCKPNNSSQTNAIEIHKVLETWESESTTWANQPEFNDTIEDYAIVQNAGWYYWSITDVVREWYESDNTGLMLKAPEWVENTTSTNSYRKQFYSADYSSNYRPILTITFRNNNGLESYWDYTASSAGRAGTGYVNDYTGNLVWIHSDIGYGGNRMPVSISHIYNANDITESSFGMGYGWRTNYNQTITTCTLPREENGTTVNVQYYVWEDSDGTEHYFYATEDGTYQDEDGLDLTLTLSNNGLACTIKDKQDNTSYFDSNGRLYKIENNQKTKSSITITYTTTSGKLIKSVTDGAGRIYHFSYSNGLLNKISYTGSGTTEIGYVTFSYTNSCLTGITYKDGETVSYSYNADRLLTAAEDIDGYRLEYSYHPISDSSWQPYRIKTISEKDGTAEGGTLTIEYDHNQTTFTDHDGRIQIMQFNNWGNTVAIQDEEGRAQFASYADTSDAGGKGNQLTAASKLQNTVASRLNENSFENREYWTNINSNTTNAVSSDYAYLGSKSLRLTASAAGGIYSGTVTIATGETWTFSAYVKTTGNSTAYLAIGDGNAILASSEILKANSDWTRLEVSYTNGSATSKTIRAQLMSDVAGIVYMDCTQFEATETASRYNLVENGDFRFGITNWTKGSGCDTDEKVITASTTATPLLTSDVFQIVGDPQKELYIQQTISVSGVEDDTFVLAGWAKAAGVPLTDDTRAFAIQGTFVYTDGEKKDFTFSFNPDTTASWQYAAGVMVAEKAYSSITIRIRYDYNANTALFDGIQLYKEEFGSSYTYDADGNVTGVKDLQAQTTTYEYENNDLTEMTLPTGAKLTYEYDDYHNVKTATTAEEIVYTFTYDDWGNNTSVSIKSGDSTITSTATYSSDGNRLVSTTDALGKTTTYSYHADTNILEWVQYPEDTDQTRTEYTYDSMYRLASAAVTTDTGSSLSVNYTYEDDLLTQLETESTTYTFAYGDFALRSSIKIGSRTLAEYSYTEDGNNYLSTLDYGNEDKVEYTYDKYGRLETQIYEDGDAVVYKYDNNGALATVTDSDGFTTKYYYDFTNRLMKYVESGENYSHSVAYTYDTMNNLTALVETINGTEFVSSYGYNDDNVLTSVTNGSQTWAFEYDSYGRLSGIDGTPFDRTYNYHSVSDTQLTAQLSSIGYPTLAAEQTYAYTYDDNGNIVSVTFGDDSYSYVYDSQNQLIRENNSQLGRTYTWDNAGNILSRSTYAYTTGELGTPTATIQYRYEDADWGDLLTGIASLNLTYDEIGNMLTFGPRSFTWEHGRQLESQTINGVTWTYSYDMDGMRTGRTNGTTTYEYIYNGSQLTRMIRNGVVVDFTYINGIPATISFGGNTFYYVTNGQGDVTGITDSSGNLQITYYYDAWGSPYCTYDSSTSIYAQSLYNLNPLLYRGYVFDWEVGLYYLQSRYYIPEIGRFLNADRKTDSGAKLFGNNLFLYCANNPVNQIDPTGESIIDFLIDEAEEYLKKEKKKKRKVLEAVFDKVSEYDLTLSGGLTLGATPSGFGFSGQTGLSIDTKGNVAIQTTNTAGFTTGTPGVNGGGYIMVTNAPNVNKLEGAGYSLGGSAAYPVYGVPLWGGMDFNIIPDTFASTIYTGLTGSVGFGTPGAEFHVNISETQTRYQFNIYDYILSKYTE